MIKPITDDVLPELLEINNLYAVEIALEDQDSLKNLVDKAFYQAHIDRQGFIIAFDQDVKLEGENINWLQARYGQFVYVDRIAVHPQGQGKGLARQLYEALFAAAREVGHEMVYCEINIDPPNAGSVIFHERLGFEAFEAVRRLKNGKRVQYFQYHL